MKRIREIIAGSALAFAVACGASGARAGAVIYQSIPDLTVPWTVFSCSECSSNGSMLGQNFTLGSSSTASTLTFAIYNPGGSPPPVTIDLFKDAGSHKLGADIYHHTFSSFSVTPEANHVDLVTVDLGDIPLTAGSYDLFMTNSNTLLVTGYLGIGAIVDNHSGAAGPSTGDHYGGLPYSTGFALAAPEPATWAMLILGVAMIGAAARRRTAGAPLAA